MKKNLVILQKAVSFYFHSWSRLDKNALTVAFSLSCLEIRSRNEEVINSTRNRIYSLKVFYFLLYQRWYFLLVSELIILLRVLAMTENISAVAGYTRV